MSAPALKSVRASRRRLRTQQRERDRRLDPTYEYVRRENFRPSDERDAMVLRRYAREADAAGVGW